MKKIFLVFLCFPLLLSAQLISNDKINLPKGLSLSNQLEYSYDTDLDREIFENWLNLDYHYGAFTSGIRFESFQPNDPNPAISRGKDKYSDIAFKYVSAKLGNYKEGLKFTVGNYYGSFGRGLIFKSYEDRNIRVDNNLLGVYVEGKYSNFILKALSGSAANINNVRNDILHAADLEYRGIKKVKLGLSVASNSGDDNNSSTNLIGARISPSFNFFDIHAEYAVKLNKDIKEEIFNNERDIIGRGFYTNLNFYYDNFSLSSEIKYYDNFNFTSEDGTIQYNTAPAGIRDYSYILLNRHPHALNQNNEKGFQVEGNYVLSEKTNFVLSYGITQTIGENSLYNKVIGSNQESRDQLEEIYGQVYHTWSDKLKNIFSFGYNEEATTSTKNLTPILETVYYLDDINTFRFIIEHQQTSNTFSDEKYYSDLITIEYLRSPNLSLSFVGEMKTSEPTSGNVKRNYWGFVQTSYKLNDYIDLSILFGSRQAGNICIGGVCRYEPEFEGIEFKMLTRLY